MKELEAVVEYMYCFSQDLTPLRDMQQYVIEAVKEIQETGELRDPFITTTKILTKEKV